MCLCVVGPFSFQAALLRNGTIIFNYLQVVKLDLKDIAYIIIIIIVIVFHVKKFIHGRARGRLQLSLVSCSLAQLPPLWSTDKDCEAVLFHSLHSFFVSLISAPPLWLLVGLCNFRKY